MPTETAFGNFKTIAVVAGVILSLAILLASLRMIWLSTLASDGAIFLALGRAILNGMTPYRDLFETKPPGIFLLGSLSLLLGGVGVAKAFSICAVLAVFAACVAASQPYGLFVGTLLAVLTAVQSGGFFPEEFGAAALCLYVAIVLSNQARLRKTVLCCVTLYLAILFKEPFLLAALAVAITLLRDRRSFLRFYLMPQAIAVTLFLLTLASLGIFREYVTLYLPFMVGVRVGGAEENGGLWAMLVDLFRFSPLFVPLVLACGTAEMTRPGLLRFGAAVLLLVTACLLGKYSGYHGTTAVPVYMAMLMTAKGKPWMLPGVIAAVLSVPLMGTIAFSGTSDDPQWLHIPQWREDQRIAAGIDRIMDRCAVGRWYNLGGPSYVYGFTHHPPSGPLLYMELFMLQNGYLVSKTLANLTRVDLILFQKKTRALYIEKQYYDLTEGEIAKHFETNPWPCAGETIDNERFVLLFRKSAG